MKGSQSSKPINGHKGDIPYYVPVSHTQDPNIGWFDTEQRRQHDGCRHPGAEWAPGHQNVNSTD